MREGRQLVRESCRFASEQRWRSWWHLGSTLVIFGSLLWLVCLDIHWSIRLAASLLASLVHVRMFVIYHDHQHGAILEGSHLASFILKLYGFLTLAPPSIWKHTHDHHHRNNSRRIGVDSIGSYPVMTTATWRQASPGERLMYMVSRHPLTIVFGYLTVFLYGFCIRPLLVNHRNHLDALASIGLHVSLIVWLGLVGLDVMLFAVLIPSFVASALGSYLFYAQHNFPGVRLRHGEEWDYVYAALRSSSFIRMNPIMHWFTGNIGYHHIHHLNARIPFYRLPETMAAFDELQVPGTTSLRPADVVRCLRLNLWDEEKDRFVSYSEGRRSRTPAPV